jgi:hypothetical protein
MIADGLHVDAIEECRTGLLHTSAHPLSAHLVSDADDVGSEIRKSLSLGVSKRSGGLKNSEEHRKFCSGEVQALFIARRLRSPRGMSANTGWILMANFPPSPLVGVLLEIGICSGHRDSATHVTAVTWCQQGRGQVTGVESDTSTGNERRRPVLVEGGSLHAVARAG